MKITILGTGSPEGMPILFDKDKSVSRLRPSLLMEHEGKNILFDASPDIRQQLLQTNIDHLDAVFITHHHFDHFWGMADLDQLHWVGKDKFTVYCTKSCKENIENNLSWLSLNVEVLNTSKQIEDITITPFLIKHSTYLDMYGFIIDCEGKRVVYAPDLLDVDKKELEKALHADVLIADGQYILGKYIEDNDHAGGKELQQLIDSFQAKQVCLVAYSEYWYKKTAKEAEQELANTYSIPNDFDTIEL